MSRLTTPIPGTGFAPFVGSRFFSGDERMLFHGRDWEITELAGAWVSGKFTILHGAAGVGKSSLLRAGVVPYLGERRADVLPVGHPGHRPRHPLAATPRQNRFSSALLSSWQPDAAPHRVSGLSVGDFLRRRGNRELMVAIDQAELLFRRSPAHERDRRRLLDELAGVLRECEEIRLLLCVREEYFAEALEFTRPMGDARTLELGPLAVSEAVKAVQGPLFVAGGTLEAGVAEQMIDEIRSDGRGEKTSAVEPALLQAVCTRLLPLPGVRPERMADAVDAALTAHVAEGLVETAADRHVSCRDLTAWLRRTFRSGSLVIGGHGDTSLLRALEDRHLVRAHRSTGDVRAFTLFHPRLAGPLGGVRRLPMAPDRPERVLRAARDALCAGRTDLAGVLAEHLISITDPHQIAVRAEAESLLGDVAYERQRPGSAIHHYRQAAEILETLQDSPAVAQLLTAVGRLLLALAAAVPARPEALRDAAVRELRAAAGRVPSDPGPRAALGQALWQAGDPTTALAVLSGALDLDGDTPEALQIRGEIFADLGSRESAKSALRDLDRVGRHPRPSSEAARALALATLSRLDAAKRALDTALAEVTDDGPVLLRAARVEDLLGDRAAAGRFAARAAQAKDPPLPSHQQGEAHLLRTKS
ncbi:nSTAND1 domain-containing NTPase [Actinomadura madurae]|uniref:nSTAND1 domain-containing NTPase n=1 Tax=Actinomadura madurae TaxID=1993 RepID=UPI0020D25D74|nr:ATP-binding protein [Actinomadura madurae]MCP9969902.1 ATP-binding protein [Actinomadura madurae]MCP9982350.1 ATP-binding protein [Actinomadura madurae]MCQ0018598.1 ATP-binding protein [Actinomadura madurae]